MTEVAAVRERLTQQYSAFNGHCNKAAKRANAEFIKQFGKKAFNKEIMPFHRKGIMSVFDSEPTIYTMAWVVLVTAYVNEDRA